MSGQRFISGSRDQAFLLPPDMREWLPDDHLVWVIVEALERCDLAALDSAYRAEGNGRPAYDPAVMAALLLYAYASGERSGSSTLACHTCSDSIGSTAALLCPIISIT